MEYRILGRTGLRVSAVALGCEGFMEKSAEEVRADLDFAIDRGINFIDIYSPNPQLRENIGAALEGRRGNFIIQGHLCTVWEEDQYLRTRDPEKTRASFETQLQQLRTDYLDIGMIHYIDAEEDFRRVFDGEILRHARRLRSEGRSGRGTRLCTGLAGAGTLHLAGTLHVLRTLRPLHRRNRHRCGEQVL